MERLTTNKNVTDMSMIELAHNSCYIDDEHNARYRDYDLDINGRQLVKSLAKDICNEDLTDLSDEEFDEYMGSMLSVEIDSTIGLLALFYRNLWAMADLRARLKSHEDAEEQGRSLQLPYPLGTQLIYFVDDKDMEIYELDAEKIEVSKMPVSQKVLYTIDCFEFLLEDFGKIVFLTRNRHAGRMSGGKRKNR